MSLLLLILLSVVNSYDAYNNLTKIIGQIIITYFEILQNDRVPFLF